MPAPSLFVYDHNFPTNLMTLVKLPLLELRPLKDVHPDLVKDHEDWEVIRELRARGGVQGWITLDSKMLNLEKEMVVLHQSKLSQVVFTGVGQDPIVATGLLMVHAATIAKQWNPRHAQLWVLPRPQTKAGRPWEYIDRLAQRAGVTPETLIDRHKLPFRQFGPAPYP